MCIRCSLASFFFFFSSRRRHTRCSRDWSSDVCSSDLLLMPAALVFSSAGWSTALMRAPRYSVLAALSFGFAWGFGAICFGKSVRSEEHTSELQSRLHLVCRLLLEKKKNNL